jgi:RHS repeat-associated protein
LNKNITHIGDNWKNLSIHIALAQDYPNATDYLCDATSNNLLAVTDEVGQVEEPLRYDARGVRKNPGTWTIDWSAGTVTDRGYTGHEHLDKFGLINMNGRIYDPQLGRFLSPDPFVTSPENPQNYNRYSYVLNNPLKYTDPSGYSKITNIINTLWSYDHGGTWTLGGGPHKFESHDEAFEAGIDYVNTTNSWGNTAYGSEQASRTIYNMIKNINYNYDINRNTVMYQGENRQYHFGYDRSTHTFYYVGTDTEVNPFEIIFGDDATNGGDGITGIPKSDVVSTLTGASAILVNTIKGGFDAARKLQPTVSTWIKGARVLGRTSNILTAATVSFDFATGTANTSTLVNAGVTVVGAGVVYTVGLAAAPWVAAGGVVYGIVSLAGGDDWLNSQWDISDKINFVKPSGQ